MRLKTLILDRFGPFEHYELDFPRENRSCLLLTGKNNEGKTTIVRALGLLSSTTRAVRRNLQSRIVELSKQDTQDIQIGRLIHNYEGGSASIRGIFQGGYELAVDLDAEEESALCQLPTKRPKDASKIFGIVPPLGPLAEIETLMTEKHIKRSLSTSLAPHHLRNHFFHLLSEEQFKLVRKIVSESWEGIELMKYEHDVESNRLHCMYKEHGIEREICWAGQGLQVWFQIITHLVRLMDTYVLVLDEPEIFLHPEKQHELIRILREYYDGSTIIATHSVELINNVDISHIVNVKKAEKKTEDKICN